ncbi:MAG: hypothetical protein ACE361_02560 [Aureliella sp.]
MSIRSVAVATAIVAAVLLPTMLSLSTHRREQALVEQLRERGVQVWYVEDVTSPMQAVDSEYWFERWALVPKSWLAHPKRVSIVEFKGESTDLASLNRLDSVKAVSYVHGDVDEDLVELFMQMDGLRSLNLSDTNVDDRALQLLVNKTELQYLNVMGTKVTPEGVRAFNAARTDCRLSVSPDQEFMKWLNQLFEDRVEDEWNNFGTKRP